RIRVEWQDPALAPLLIPKGSVAVDGVSLTVAALDDRAFEVMVIPHTLERTTLGSCKPGRRVNLEMDGIGNYVLRSLKVREESSCRPRGGGSSRRSSKRWRRSAQGGSSSSWTTRIARTKGTSSWPPTKPPRKQSTS